MTTTLRSKKKIEYANVTIYTDGAASSSGTRSYHGGHAAILLYRGQERIVRGGHYPATNQTMELQALISGLEALTEPCRVEFYSDALYVVDGINLFLENWIRKGWPERIANQEQWKKLAGLRRIHSLHGNWIRGHAPKKGRTVHQEYNVRCDEIAVEEAWACFNSRRGEKANV